MKTFYAASPITCTQVTSSFLARNLEPLVLLIIEYVAVFEIPFGCPGFQDTALVCSRGVHAV